MEPDNYYSWQSIVTSSRDGTQNHLSSVSYLLPTLVCERTEAVIYLLSLASRI